jgi:hypothetical protein
MIPSVRGGPERVTPQAARQGGFLRLNPDVEEGKMTRRNVLFSLVGSAVACLLLGGVGEATVPRAFVSINGSDASPCSAVAPCRSFNQALTVVEAGGEVVVQDSGGYSTGFGIRQSVTIDAAGFNASVISTNAADLCIINAGASDRVVLRGISFHGASVGTSAINVTQVGSLYVEHCSIAEFTGDGVRMANGGNLWVTDTDVRKVDVGLFAGSGSLAFNLVAQDSRFTECGTGVFLATFGTGTATGWLSNCTASLCVDGFFLESDTAANADLTLTNCRAFGSTLNGLFATTASTGTATMRIANCVVTRNNFGISTFSSGSGIASVIGTSPGTNFISGNTMDGSPGSSVTLR